MTQTEQHTTLIMFIGGPKSGKVERNHYDGSPPGSIMYQDKDTKRIYGYYHIKKSAGSVTYQALWVAMPATLD